MNSESDHFNLTILPLKLMPFKNYIVSQFRIYSIELNLFTSAVIYLQGVLIKLPKWK